MIYRFRRDPEPAHKFSSTQVEITGRPAEMMRKVAAAIQPSDLGEDGKESNLHVTVKYGLHFTTPSARLRDVLKDFGPVTLTFGKTSLFTNDDADVLKVEVDSPDLHRLNKLVSRVVPTHDTFPKYIPHATIAYLKPGKGKKYAGDKSLAGQSITVDAVTFSGKNGHMETMPLGRPSAAYRVR